MRGGVRRAWEKYVKARTAANPAHESYCFCDDGKGASVICVLQLYTSETAIQDFLKGEGASSADYLYEVSQFVAAHAKSSPAALVPAKTEERQ